MLRYRWQVTYARGEWQCVQFAVRTNKTTQFCFLYLLTNQCRLVSLLLPPRHPPPDRRVLFRFWLHLENLTTSRESMQTPQPQIFWQHWHSF
jgi:hypothetical protein